VVVAVVVEWKGRIVWLAGVVWHLPHHDMIQGRNNKMYGWIGQDYHG
jgi:hypothetical protein